MKSIRHLTGIFLLVALTVFASSAPAIAQDNADVVRELKRIGLALEKLEKTMSADLETSRSSLLLQRAELEVSGITSLESQVRNARTSRDAQLTQEDHMNTTLGELERQAFDSDDPEKQEELRRQQRQMAAHMETVRKQTQSAEQTLYELEDELAQRSRVFESLKAQIDDLLGLN